MKRHEHGIAYADQGAPVSRRRKTGRPPLPGPCGECRPQDGLWRIGPQGGLERCDCARGRALANLWRTRGRNKRKSGPPPHDGRAAAAGNT